MASRPASGGLAGLLAQPRSVPVGRTPAAAVAPAPPAEPSRETRAALAASGTSAGLGRRRGTPLRSPLRNLEILAGRRLRLEHGEAVAVRAARAAGHTWQQVADALDVPLPTLHRRYRA